MNKNVQTDNTKRWIQTSKMFIIQYISISSDANEEKELKNLIYASSFL